MPNSRIRNDVPNSGIKNYIPSSRISAFQTGHAGEDTRILGGMPIGLLLSLTYAENRAASISPYGDFRPNSRVINL